DVCSSDLGLLLCLVLALAAAFVVRRVPALPAVGIWAVAFVWTLAALGPPATDAMIQHGLGARILLRTARQLADRDHDGYSSILGGGGCNDHDPRIPPRAADIPGNGIDEDCDGADAKPVVAEKLPTASDRARAFRWKGNVLLITIDALRVDRMRPDLMPRLSKLAAESVVFTNARSQAPNTPR